MVQSIVPVNNQTEVGEYLGEPLEGFEGFTPQDLQIPVLRVVQGTSRMEDGDKHMGEFWHSITGEFKPSVDVVILNVKHTRALFSGDPSEGDKPECLSDDCITGTFYGACAGCGFNADLHRELWEPGAKRCNKGYRLLVSLVEDGSFASFSASKTAVQPMKVLFTQFQIKKLPLFGAVVTLSTERTVEGAKKWYKLSAKIKEVLPRADVIQYRDTAKALTSQHFEVVDSEPVTVSGTVVEDATYVEEPPENVGELF